MQVQPGPQQSRFQPKDVGGKFGGFPKSCTMICSGILPTQPTRDNVQKEFAFAAANSSDFPETKEGIEQKPENARDDNGDSFSYHDERGKSSTQTADRAVPRDKRPKVSTCETDDDTFKVKERLAAEREVLNRTYLELERERSASASAANEAMALITRLQEVKVALRMEAVQYQRVAEERAMFDEEAIVTLRDILLKREAEKLALEKEIDLYRRKLLMGVLEAGEKRLKENEVDAVSAIERDDEASLSGSLKRKEMHMEQGISAGGANVVKVSCARGGSDAELVQTLSFMSDETKLLKPFEFLIDDGTSSEEGIVEKDGDNHEDGSPESVKDSYYEDQTDVLDNFRWVQSSSTTVAMAPLRDQYDDTKRKFVGLPEIHRDSVLSREWSSEEQITGVRTVEALPSQERREKRGSKKFKHVSSAAKQRASHKLSGARYPSKRIVRARSETDIFPSISKRWSTFDTTHAEKTVSCQIDPTSNRAMLDLLKDSSSGHRICGETKDRLTMLDPFPRTGMTLEKLRVQEKPSKLDSSSFCSSSEEEFVPSDAMREATGDNASERSKFLSRGTVCLEPHTESMCTTDRCRNNMQEEIRKIMDRLQRVESDSSLLRQAIESVRKEIWGPEQLLDVAQQVRLLLANEGDSGSTKENSIA